MGGEDLENLQMWREKTVVLLCPKVMGGDLGVTKSRHDMSSVTTQSAQSSDGPRGLKELPLQPRRSEKASFGKRGCPIHPKG